MSPMPDRQTTEYRATQLVYSIKFKLSHAIKLAKDDQKNHITQNEVLDQADEGFPSRLVFSSDQLTNALLHLNDRWSSVSLSRPL